MNLSQSFDKLINSTYFRHRGLLIEKSGNFLIWKKMKFGSVKELDKYLDGSFEALGNSIKKALPIK